MGITLEIKTLKVFRERENVKKKVRIQGVGNRMVLDLLLAISESRRQKSSAIKIIN